MTAQKIDGTPDNESLDLSVSLTGVASAKPASQKEELMLELNTPAGGSFDLSVAIVEAPPAAAIGMQKHEEHRGEPRFRVRWRVTTLTENNETYHGFIKDISSKGVAILLEHSLPSIANATLHIHIPPLSSGAKPRIMEIQGKCIYSIHDSEELYFRSGFSFTRFNSDADQSYLQSRLNSYYLEIKDQARP